MSGFTLADYEPVEVRLERFWKDHPQGRIETHLVPETREGEYVVKASVWRDRMDTLAAATGFAQEREAERGVNATSALENCETSAIGRALANLGYAAKGKRPSREEMSKAAAPDRTADAATTEPGPSSRGGSADPGSVTPPEPVPPGHIALTCAHKLVKTEAPGVWRCEKCEGIGKLAEFKNVVAAAG